MLSTLDPALLERIRFPLGEQTKAETRAEAAAAGLAAADAPGEPGGVLPRRRRLPALPRAAGPRCEREGRIVDEDGRGARQPRRLLAVHAGPAPRARRRRRRVRSTCCAPTAPTNDVVVGPRESLAATRVEARGALYRSERNGSTAKLRYRSAPVPARVVIANGGFSLELDEPAYAVATGQVAALYDATRSSGPGVITRVD